MLFVQPHAHSANTEARNTLVALSLKAGKCFSDRADDLRRRKGDVQKRESAMPNVRVR